MERSTVQSCLAAPFYPIKSVFLRTPSKSRMGLNAERCRRMHLFCHVSDTQEHVSFSHRTIKIGTLAISNGRTRFQSRPQLDPKATGGSRHQVQRFERLLASLRCSLYVQNRESAPT